MNLNVEIMNPYGSDEKLQLSALCRFYRGGYIRTRMNNLGVVTSMSVRHFNRNRSKVMPKAYADCSSRPARNRRQAKRDKRVSDRREAKLNREMALARNFVGAAI